MAGCDNLYGNKEQWNELYEFLVKTKPEYIKLYMTSEPENGEIKRICYIPAIQEFLIKDCHLKWVQEKLNDCFLSKK